MLLEKAAGGKGDGSKDTHPAHFSLPTKGRKPK